MTQDLRVVRNNNAPMSSGLTFNPKLAPETTFDQQLMRYMELIIHKYCDGSAEITEADMLDYEQMPVDSARNMMVLKSENGIEFKLLTSDEARETVNHKHSKGDNHGESKES